MDYSSLHPSIDVVYLSYVRHDRVAGAGRHHEARPLRVAGLARHRAPPGGRDVVDEAGRHLCGRPTGKGQEKGDESHEEF